MAMLSPVLLVVTLCLSRTVHARTCTFISEDIKTCDVNVQCSFNTNDLQNAIKGHHCTEKQKQTRVISHDYEYDHYGNRYRMPNENEEYDGAYLRQFQLNLSLNLINFETEPYLIEHLSDVMLRVKILSIQNSIGVPMKFVSHFKELHHIELHTELNTIDLNMFLEFDDMKNIDVSNSSILILETKSQEIGLPFASKVTDINLSYNFIQEIPNDYFIHFVELRNINLSHNNLKRFDLLTFKSLLTLQNLQLSYNKLTKIGHSLVRFINLEELLIDNNQLETIVETNFLTTTKLQRLNMSSNQISLIENKSFETLAELNVIDLGNNKISTVSKWWFANNSNLDTAILSNNEIMTIEQGAFIGKNITKFGIENNCLNGILETGTFEGLHVDRLDLSNGNLTQIKDGAFYSSSIRMLNLNSNSIESISKRAFESLDMIEVIDLSNNCLKDIEFEMVENSKITVLKGRNNSISKITGKQFKNFISLSYLDLSCNLISKVEPQSFINLVNLKILVLNNNELLRILPKEFFQGLTEVIDINISFTRIMQLQNESFMGLKNLQILNVSHSELANVDYNVFAKTESIQILDFSYNLLKVFQINTSTILGITEIRLSYNQLKQVSSTFSGLVNLQTLDLANNDFAKLIQNELRNLENLSNLDLSSNTNLEINGSIFSNLTRLVKVSLRNVKGKLEFEHVTNTSIDVLDLSHCNITELDKIFVYNVRDVYNLNLASNKIARLNKFSFQTMSSLAELDLSDNLLSFIQPGTFTHTNKVTSLNLSGNQLTHLQFGVLDGLQILHTLNLSSNILREFSSTLLHNTPVVNTIALDNNALEDLKVSDYFYPDSIVISIGGNPIPCHILTKIKEDHNNNGPYHTNLKVKAEIEDYHSENVDGITCISDNPDTKIVLRVNDTNINSTVIVAALSNAIDAAFRTSIEKLNQNLNNSSYKADNENLQILHELSELNNQSRNYLKQLTDTSVTKNDTFKFYTDIKDLLKNLTLTNKKNTERIIYVKTNETGVVDQHLLEKIKILNEEKEKIVDELKDIINEFKKDNNRMNTQALKEVRNDNGGGDIKGILYFIAVCLTIIIVGYVCKIAYPLVISKNRLVRRNDLHNSVSSTQPISNVLEMQ